MGKVCLYEKEAAEDWCFNIKIEKTQLLSSEKLNKFKKTSGKNLTLSDDTIEEVLYTGSQELSEEKSNGEQMKHVALTGTEFAKLSKTLNDLMPGYLYDENQNCTLASHLEEKMNSLDKDWCKRMTMRMKWNVLVSKEAHQEKAHNRLSVSKRERVTLHAEISITFS